MGQRHNECHLLTSSQIKGSTGSARERHGLFRCGALVAARLRSPSIQCCDYCMGGGLMGCVSAVTKLSIVRDRFTPTSRIVTLCTPSARL